LVDGTPPEDIGGTPADDGPYDFFVSYSPGDKEWADWIAWQLEKELRLTLFVRGWHVVAGHHKVISRDSALAVSTRLLAILTPEYLTSDEYGTAEWGAARGGDPVGRARQVVPVVVKECRPGPTLGSITPIDLVGQDAAVATATLLSGITAVVEGHARPSTAPAFPGEPPAAAPSFPGPPVVVSEPPTVPPNWFQDRSTDIEAIERRLGDARTGLVMVVGKESLGKTAMIHQLWEHIRTRRSPMRVHGLVYRSAHGFWPVTPDNVIDGLIDVFPKHEVEQLTGPIQQHAIWVEKLVILLTALAGRQVIIAIDAVEELLDEDSDIADTALRTLVDHVVPRAGHGVRLLLVGRQAARAVAQRFPDATYHHTLKEGLSEDDAFALLQAMDADRRLNLDDVSAHDRTRLHRLTGGAPRTLELAYGLLASGDFSFTRLLDFMSARRDDIVTHLLAHACEQLPFEERRVLQMLAVYGRSVQPTAVEHLVRTSVPGLEVRPVLKRLSGLRLAQFDGECYSVSAATECDYLIKRLRGEARTGACESPEAFLRRAAAYFAGRRHHAPRRLDDLRPELMEIELTLRAGDNEKALELMGDVDDKYLHGWGSSSALVQSLLTLLDTNGIATDLEIHARSLLARAFIQQEDHRAAADQLDSALRRVFGLERRITLWRQLTAANVHLGEPRTAAWCARKAYLAAAVLWHRYRSDKAGALAELALCQAKQGRLRPALRRFERARRMLERSDTTADRVDQLPILLDEAWAHGQLGERDQARSLLLECRRRAGSLGERAWLGRCVLSEAQLALDDGELPDAVTLAEEASAIGVSNGNRWLCGVATEVLATAQLERGDLPAATRAADITQRNRSSILGFGLVGLAAYRRDNDTAARVAFSEGRAAASDWRRAKEPDFQLLDAYGLVACGLALLGEPSGEATALTVFGQARKLTSAPGAVARILMLLKQFEPRADPATLERIRGAARG
jgi:tetratricopeptide (TPR) repeat protein